MRKGGSDYAWIWLEGGSDYAWITFQNTFLMWINPAYDFLQESNGKSGHEPEEYQQAHHRSSGDRGGRGEAGRCGWLHGPRAYPSHHAAQGNTGLRVHPEKWEFHPFHGMPQPCWPSLWQLSPTSAVLADNGSRPHQIPGSGTGAVPVRLYGKPWSHANRGTMGDDPSTSGSNEAAIFRNSVL